MCFLLLFLVLCNISRLSSETHKLTTYFKKYDIVDCFVSGIRSKRNLHYTRNGRISHALEAEVYFKLREKDFNLLLVQDPDFEKVKVESFSSHNFTTVEAIDASLFHGVLKNESLSSHIIGYIQDNVFVGIITLTETVYFIEPASRFFSNLTTENKVLVYKGEDVLAENDHFVLKRSTLWEKFRDRFNFDVAEILPKGINKSANASEDYACVIEVVADHTLYNYFEGNLNKLAAYLYMHIKQVDSIFRRTDFDGDGKRDRIRIIPGKIFIFKSENDPDYPMKAASDLNKYLRLFSLRTQNYCLSICVTFRDSRNSVIGVAFRAHSSSYGPPGGICQKPIQTFSSAKQSVNSAVVTIRDRNGIALPIAVSILAIAHEIGHSFGSEHDAAENLLCSPGNKKGFYLMHPKSQSGQTSLSSFFSPCSKKSIAGVIASRGECLKPYPATCGNSVQEGEEECDCGKEVTCQYVDHCCTPSDAKQPESGCTFRKTRGSVCSPTENECCFNNCTVNKDKNVQCYNDFLTCKISYCDGENATCPEPEVAPDKYPCRGTSKSCSGGFCNSSVCLDNNLKNCVCENSFECYVCCDKAGSCVTATSLGFLTSSGKEYYALEGTPCNLERFQCDGQGRCIDPLRRGKDSTKKRSFSFWWAIGGLTFALMVILLVLIYLFKEFALKKQVLF